jgi:apolipoprotein N-acyltransferase
MLAIPLWLAWLLAVAVLPFHAHHHVVPVAAWVAPLFLLRWSRRSHSGGRAWLGVVAAIALGDWLAFQGGYFQFPALVLPAIALASGLFWSVPYVLDRWAIGRLPVGAASFVFPAGVAALDALNAGLSPLGAWGSPAFSQAPGSPFSQVAAVAGLAGVTFLVHALAPAVEEVWHGGRGSRALRPLAVAVAIVAAVFVAGGLRLRAVAPRTVRVAAVAASAERYADAWKGLRVPAVAKATDGERASYRAQFERNVEPLFARTIEAARAGARLVAWPESVPVLEEDLAAFLGRARTLAIGQRVYLVVAPEMILRATSKPFARNLSILIDPDGVELWRYDKTHPVPGIEDGRLAPGAGRLPVVDTEIGRLSTAICFDLDFGALAAQAGSAGVELLIAPADDWPAIREMHPRMAAFRAVEHGFALLRPASQGISTAVDARGRTVARASSLDGGDGFFVVDLPLSRPTR